MQFDKDSLYANPLSEIAAFQFDESVVSVFPDMIQRSVPGYAAIFSARGMLVGRFGQEDSICYDLGYSPGGNGYARTDRCQEMSHCRCRQFGIHD